jgi:hypothetical protein
VFRAPTGCSDASTPTSALAAAIASEGAHGEHTVQQCVVDILYRALWILGYASETLGLLFHLLLQPLHVQSVHTP